MEPLVIGYRRLSTNPQTKKFGKAVQRGKISEALEARELKADKHYTDVCDGYTLKRKMLQKILSLSDDGKVAVLAVGSLCRLSRRPKHIRKIVKQLIKNETRIISADEGLDTSDSASEQVLNLISYQVTINTAHRQENLERGKSEAIKNGLPGFGSAPYGYRYEGGELVIVEDDAKVVKEIYRLGFEEYTLRGIATRLNSEGIPSPRDREWSHKTVGKILSNPAYIGVLIRGYMGEEEVTYKADYAIVDLDIATRMKKKWLDFARKEKVKI